MKIGLNGENHHMADPQAERREIGYDKDFLLIYIRNKGYALRSLR